MKIPITKLLAILATLSILNSLQADEKPIAPKAVKMTRKIDYTKDIAPILKKNCIACHNAKTKEGDLNLESPQLMRKGGESGEPILVETKPDKSYLYLVASRIEEPVMPPLPNKMNAHKLTGEEVWKIRQWIIEGAKGKASTTRAPLNWVGPAAHLQPIYSLALTPNDDQVVAGIGNHIEVISLTDTNIRQKLIDPELKSYAHRDFVNAVAVDPTGQFIASAGYRMVKIWERSQPRLLHTASIASKPLIASRSNNGQHYCVVNQAGKVFVGSDQPGLNFDSGLKQVSAIAVDDKGETVLLATGKEIRITQIPTKKTMIVPVKSEVHSLVLWEGKILAGHADGAIRIWHQPANAKTFQAETAELKKHKTAVTKLELLQNSPLGLVSFSADGMTTLWDLPTKKPKIEWKVGADVTSLAISPDRKRIATVHKTGRVIVWNEQKKAERTILNPAALLHQLKTAGDNLAIAKSLLAHSQALLKASQKNVTDRKAGLVKAKKAVPESTKAFEATKKPKADATAALEAVKKEIAASKQTPALKKKLDAAQKVFDTKQKAFTEAEQKMVRSKRIVTLETASIKKGESELVAAKKNLEQATAHSKSREAKQTTLKTEVAKNNLQAVAVRFLDSQRIQLITKQAQLESWNLKNGLPLETQALQNFKQCNQAISLANNRVACLDEQAAVNLVDFTTIWKLRTRLGPADGKLAVTQSKFVNRVASLAFSSDGKLLATGGGDPSRSGELMLWDWQNSKLARDLPQAHSDVVLSVQFSSDGKKLLTGAADKFAKIFEVTTAKMTRSFEGHTEHILRAAWTADGLSIATASADKTIKIWNTQNGSQKRTISSFGKQVTDLNYVGTSDNLVSSCGDKVVRMYQAGNGRNYRNFSGANNYLYAVAVTGNEDLVVGGGQSGILRIWDGKNGKLLNSIKPAP